jgi:hypothetical protein
MTSRFSPAAAAQQLAQQFVKSIPPTNSLLQSNIKSLLRNVDTGFSWYGWHKNFLFFDNDHTGNGKGPFLKFRLYNGRLKLVDGTLLKKDEKNKNFYFPPDLDMDTFVSTIADFTRNYMDSINIDIRYTRD